MKTDTPLAVAHATKTAFHAPVLSEHDASDLIRIRDRIATQENFSATLRISDSKLEYPKNSTWRESIYRYNQSTNERYYIETHIQDGDSPHEWIEAAEKCGDYITESEAGFFAFPSEYSNTRIPLADACVSSGLSRWLVACYQFSMRRFGKIESPLHWTCKSPAALSCDLIDFLVPASYGNPPEHEPIPFEQDDPYFLAKALEMKADMVKVTSDSIYREMHPEGEGTCPRSQRERLKRLGAINTFPGGGITLTRLGIVYANRYLAAQ